MAPPRTLLHVYPSFALGGAQRRFIQIADHFGRLYRHLIIALDGCQDAFGLLSPELDASLMTIEKPSRALLRDLPAFAAILRRVRPDLLVTLNWGSIEWAMAALMLNQPHLHLEDGFGPEEARKQISRRVWIRRLALRRANVVVPSRRLYHLAAQTWRLPRRNLLYLPNGVDLTRFDRAPDPAAARAFGLAEDRPVIGTVAALRPEKALNRLIEAFALLRHAMPAQLVIIGDGPQRGALMAQAQQCGLAGDILFTGACATPELLLPSFSLFALSSDTEQMPLSLLEAMAAGRAVVSTDVGDVRFMLAPENQQFITPCDAAAFADSLAALLDDPGLRTKIGAANLLRAKNQFSDQAMFARYRRLYDGDKAALISAEGDAGAA